MVMRRKLGTGFAIGSGRSLRSVRAGVAAPKKGSENADLWKEHTVCKEPDQRPQSQTVPIVQFEQP